MDRDSPVSTGTLAAPHRNYDYELVLVAYHSRPLVEALLATLPAELPVVIIDNCHGADGLGRSPTPDWPLAMSTALAGATPPELTSARAAHV